MQTNEPFGSRPRGGTEIMAERLFAHLPLSLLSAVHVSMGGVAGPLRHLKPHIFWDQQSYDQPAVQNLADPRVVAAVDVFAFVSEWQRAMYFLHFPIPPEKTVVIRNAVEPIEPHEKPKGKIRLVYTSTPFRGLDVLLEAFALLNRPDVELHIFSSMKIYAQPELDAQFQALYERANAMRNVFYYGSVPNEEIREALKSMHIFAYPNTWEETSCIALIEAMDAGCLCVVPERGALSETASGFAQLYPAIDDKKEHATRFAKELESAINRFWQPETQAHLARQKAFFDAHYSWEARAREWEALIKRLLWGGK